MSSKAQAVIEEFNSLPQVEQLEVYEAIARKVIPADYAGQFSRPVWEVIEEIGAAVPAEDWDQVPTDAAQNLDRYLYGNAKK